MSLGFGTLFGVLSIAGVAIVPILFVAPMIRRLVRTGLRRVTFDVDAEQLHLLTFGYGRPRTLAWDRRVVLDVLVHHCGGGIYELHIILAAEPPVSLLYGARRAELAFVAAELRRALHVDERRRSVAGWWGDAVEAIADEHDGDDSGRPILNYAPEPKDHLAREQFIAGVRVFIPPPTASQILRRQWRLFAADIAILSVIVFVNVRTSNFAGAPVWGLYAGILACMSLSRFIGCFEHRSIEIDAARITLRVRRPLLGEKMRSWPAESVRNVIAAGAKVVLYLRSGTADDLAACATPADAVALARSLHPPAAPRHRTPAELVAIPEESLPESA
jgi:hypothetical protein